MPINLSTAFPVVTYTDKGLSDVDELRRRQKLQSLNVTTFVIRNTRKQRTFNTNYNRTHDGQHTTTADGVKMQWHSTVNDEKPRKQPRRQHHNSGATLNVSKVQSQENEYVSHSLNPQPCGPLRPSVFHRVQCQVDSLQQLSLIHI